MTERIGTDTDRETVDTSTTIPAVTEVQTIEPDNNPNSIAAIVRASAIGKEHALGIEPSIARALRLAILSSKTPERGVPRNPSDVDHATHGSWD